MLQDAIGSRSQKSGRKSVKNFSFYVHKMEVLLTKFYLRALLKLSEGVLFITRHYKCLLGTIILASAAICQPLIDVTSQ